MNFAERSDVTPVRSRSRKLTSQMNEVELARVIGENRGFLAGSGGWIYTAAGKPIAHGYQKLAEQYVRKGAIVVGRGIDWSRV